MATCRRRLGATLALGGAVAMVASGCGGGARSPSRVVSRFAAVAPARAPFAWLRPRPTPSDWLVARLSSGASIAYPRGWRAIAGDRGTVSAALLDGAGRYLGYLNLTPRQGEERAASWASFRVRHNSAEGERGVALGAEASGLRFRAATGTCVQDAYTTASGTRYEEIACLVAGSRVSTVVVGAAPEPMWPRERATIERAISAMSS
jgi:hypothetical protein